MWAFEFRAKNNRRNSGVLKTQISMFENRSNQTLGATGICADLRNRCEKCCFTALDPFNRIPRGKPAEPDQKFFLVVADDSFYRF
jgi:hypothetical protein